MADDLPYLLGVKNLDAILEKIKTAGTPPKFTVDFLKTSLGFTSSSDRGVMPVGSSSRAMSMTGAGCGGVRILVTISS